MHELYRRKGKEIQDEIFQEILETTKLTKHL